LAQCGRSHPGASGRLLTAKCTLVHLTWLPFAGGRLNVGLDRFRFGHGDVSKPHAGPTGDDWVHGGS
jgi:hypothetical protein